MGDKFKSEVQKPVNNPLLSGAGHGFPFDTFQGSSLLVPVLQENPPALSDQIGEPDKFVGQDVPNLDPATRLNDALNISVVTRNDQQPPTQPTSSGYVRLFNAFFGGGKSEQEKDSTPGTTASVSSSRSFSPYVHVPNFQTVTPALQVPPTTTASSASVLDSFQTNVSSLQSPLENAVDALTVNADLSSSDRSLSSDRPPSLPQPSFNSSDNFHSQTHPQQAPPTGNYPPPLFHQPTSDLNQPNQSAPPSLHGTYYSPAQDRSASMPPLANPNAPPLFRGDSSKTYRLGHSRRPVYAPIPGLTLSSPSSASVIQGGASTVTAPLSQGYPAPVAVSQPLAYSPPITQATVYPSAAPPTGSVSQSSFTSQQTAPSASFYFNSPSVVDSFQSTFVQKTNPSPVCAVAPAQSINQPVQPVPPTVQSIPSQPVQPVPPTVHPPHTQPVQPVQPTVQAPSQPTFAVAPTVYAPTIQSITSPNMQPAPATSQSASSLPYTTDVEGRDSQSLFAPISKVDSDTPDINLPVTIHNPVAVLPSGNLPTNLQPQSIPENVSSPPIIPPSFDNLAYVGLTGIAYRPPHYHWCYKKESDSKEYWYPFSMTDSVTLEQTYQSGKVDENTVIATDGGRYDVNIMKRIRTSVYWEETPKDVRRCSWFYKNQNEVRYRPYDESTAHYLEEEYKKCVTTDSWRKRVDLKNGEYIIFNSATNVAHFDKQSAIPGGWDGDFSDGSQSLPSPTKIVKRGISDDFDIDDGEAPKVDHLVFVVHGIGSACDLKFRTIEEAVETFRSISHRLIKDHFTSSVKKGEVNRIEILPISWHHQLHGETTGLDKKLASITLKSIPRLRHFTNDTLLDILFYTSPVYCQSIVQQVGGEITKIFNKFKSRNPTFNGGVSLVGHSLGSLILFDMLCHQIPSKEDSNMQSQLKKTESKLTKRMSGFVVGNTDIQQPNIDYPQLPFQPVALFALGSPIGMFVTVRGIDLLGIDFKLPTCSRFYNIFHPFDPVAYRIEALVNPELSEKRPVLIPHHKGRKRMHLELKETISRVGADLKQRLVDSIRSTWNTMYQLTAFGRADDGLEQEVDKVINNQIAGSEVVTVGIPEEEPIQCDLGQLNMGRRIDFVLQEAPLESFNEYVSAIRSHLIYWDSEDTVLMIIKEIYNVEGIHVDIDSLTRQDSARIGSQKAPGVGWNISDSAAQTPSPGDLPPGYGFVND